MQEEVKRMRKEMGEEQIKEEQQKIIKPMMEAIRTSTPRLSWAMSRLIQDHKRCCRARFLREDDGSMTYASRHGMWLGREEHPLRRAS